MVASPLAAALIAAVGVGADGAVGGAHRGELGALVLVWGREGDAGKEEGMERQGLDLQGGELVRKTEKQVFWDLPVQRPCSFRANPWPHCKTVNWVSIFLSDYTCGDETARFGFHCCL